MSLLQTIAEKLAEKNPNDPSGTTEKLKKTLMSIANSIVWGAGRLAADSFIPGTGAVVARTDKAIGEDKKEKELETADPSRLLDNLRAQFAEATKAFPKRLVVFVDDLDRLEPIRAIEVMEAIKVLLDVENVVFVLAIDFEVVRSGIKDLLELGVRKSPRSIKRIINSWILVDNVHDNAQKATPIQLFAALTLRIAAPDDFKALVTLASKHLRELSTSKSLQAQVLLEKFDEALFEVINATDIAAAKEDAPGSIDTTYLMGKA